MARAQINFNYKNPQQKINHFENLKRIGNGFSSGTKRGYLHFQNDTQSIYLSLDVSELEELKKVIDYMIKIS